MPLCAFLLDLSPPANVEVYLPVGAELSSTAENTESRVQMRGHQRAPLQEKYQQK